MSDSFYNAIVIIFFTVVPLVLLSLQAFLSTRKRILWCAFVPMLWSALGVWMIVAAYQQDRGFSAELAIFFLAGDLILIGVSALIKNRKRKESNT